MISRLNWVISPWRTKRYHNVIKWYITLIDVLGDITLELNDITLEESHVTLGLSDTTLELSDITERWYLFGIKWYRLETISDITLLLSGIPSELVILTWRARRYNLGIKWYHIGIKWHHLEIHMLYHLGISDINFSQQIVVDFLISRNGIDFLY